MKLMFIGAAHEVTGSCHYVEACGKKFLVDCGMEQGINLFENTELPVNPSEVDFVLVTHAHIDHTGMLPKLYKDGFKGQIYATSATCDLSRIMLRDSAHIQEFEAEWKNRKAQRSGAPVIEPIYTVADADETNNHFVSVDYGHELEVCEGIRIRFTDVGHLLGSAAIEVWLCEEGVTKKLVFSGDVGNIDQPIIKDPQPIKDADYLLIESTYGDRTHGDRPDYVAAFTQVLQETFDKGGNVVIPSFAVGRTQEILYTIRDIKEKGLVKGHDGFEVYVDSPLAIESTTIFDKHFYDCFDEDAMSVVRRGVRPIVFPGLRTTVTSDESKLINFDPSPKVIISASGMCEAGRIRHHLKHNLWRPECTICFVGYQAVGTLGRKLIEGEKLVTLFGEKIEVRARIKSIKGVSGHADMNGLLNWIGYFEKKPEKVFVVHGEDHVTDNFAELISSTYGISAIAPYSGGEVDLASGEVLSLGERIEIVRTKASSTKHRNKNVFDRLLEAGRRLMDLIMQYDGCANKDIEAFEKQINNLCEKWKK